ncbi:hypothetical protein EJF36_20145 [Bacillus sp. HMF5848]|nr:hypothetical protein EJF36_20145 [Bacillus sp. HMF5848]
MDTTKLSHDRYEVYVDGDYVGQKTLLNQSDDITDVNDFLKGQGHTAFSGVLDGDHYNIQAQSTEEAQQIKDALHIYLQTR